MSSNQLLVSPSTVIVKIALTPSIVAATTLLSSDPADVIVAVVLEASVVSPMSKSMSFEFPTIVIDAVTVPQELLFPVLSQRMSMSLELPVTLNVPV